MTVPGRLVRGEKGGSWVEVGAEGCQALGDLFSRGWTLDAVLVARGERYPVRCHSIGRGAVGVYGDSLPERGAVDLVIDGGEL